MPSLVELTFTILVMGTLISFISCQSNVAKTTIVISLDGVGWQFLGNDKTDTPNFDFIARTGVKAKNMITVNPTYTLPTHVTFLTGLYPESHGIVSNNFYDPDLDAEYYLETDCSYFNPKFYQQSEPIWLTMEKRGIKTGSYFWPTSTSYEQKPSFYAAHVCNVNCSAHTEKSLKELRKRIGTRHCKFDSYRHPFWVRVETTIRWMKSKIPPRLMFLYFDYSDGIGHQFGPNSLYYLQSIEYLDRHVIGYLIDRLKDANLLDTTNIMVVSDHSMIETRSERHILLSDVIDPSIYVTNKPGIWPIGGNSVDKVFNTLTKLKNPHIKFYKKQDIPENVHWKHNRRIPPIYVQADLGWTFEKILYTKPPWVGGSHGWEPAEELGAIFYARGPSFKEGFYYNGSLRAIDIYPLLCHLVGIDPLPNNGSLHNMLHLLKTTAPDDETNTKPPANSTTQDMRNGTTLTSKDTNGTATHINQTNLKVNEDSEIEQNNNTTETIIINGTTRDTDGNKLGAIVPLNHIKTSSQMRSKAAKQWSKHVAIIMISTSFVVRFFE